MTWFGDRFNESAAECGAAAALPALLSAPAEERAEVLAWRTGTTHSAADCEVEGRLATVAESGAALEVSPSHAEALAECGGPAAAALALPYRVMNPDGRASLPSCCARPTPWSTAAARSALQAACSARCGPDTGPSQATLPPSDAPR